MKVGCDFLVVGFDQSNLGHIFSVSNPTTDSPSFVANFDDPGFGAIGSGGVTAESVLYGFGHNQGETLYDTIYQVCAAKFASETASDVGERTVAEVIQKGEKKFLLPKLTDSLRTMWEDTRPRVPNNAREEIQAYLEEQDE